MSIVVARRLIFCALLFTVIASGECYSESRTNLLVVVQNGKYGYIDRQGNLVITAKFLWADDFWQGLGTVYVCGRYASIDEKGTLHPLRISREGYLTPRKSGDKFGFVDGSGQFKIPAVFTNVLPFSEGLAAVQSGEKWGFIDISGHTVLDPQFEAAFYFREGVAVAELGSSDVLIDKSGKVLAEGYHFLDLIAEERVPVLAKDGKSGYLDLTGKIAIPLVFDSVRAFSGGMAAVEKGKKWGYVDRNGQMVILPQFDEAGPFANGLAPVKIEHKSGFIDQSGKFAFLLAFDYSPGFLTEDEQSGLFIAPASVSRFWTDDQKFGYVNTSGRIIWGPVEGSPDHLPLLGWSEEDKAKSCEGIPESIKKRVAGFAQP